MSSTNAVMYVCMEGGERIDSSCSIKNYLRKVIGKRRRWMGLGTRTLYVCVMAYSRLILII